MGDQELILEKLGGALGFGFNCGVGLFLRHTYQGDGYVVSVDSDSIGTKSLSGHPRSHWTMLSFVFAVLRTRWYAPGPRSSSQIPGLPRSGPFAGDQPPVLGRSICPAQERNRRYFLRPAALIVLAALLCGGGSGASRQSITQGEILRRTQELFDAVAPGNRQPWQEYIADDVMYFDEHGHNMDKTALLATIDPLPPGVSGTIKVVNTKFNTQGNTLIHSYDMHETENVHGQELRARYHATDTWMNRNGEWQIIAAQVLRYYEDPTPGIRDPQKFHDYVGTYGLAGQREVVFSEQGKLYLTRGTRPRVELIPEVCDLFFRKGIEGRELFHYSGGKVDSLIDRRNDEDVIWKKLK